MSGSRFRTYPVAAGTVLALGRAARLAVTWNRGTLKRRDERGAVSYRVPWGSR